MKLSTTLLAAPLAGSLVVASPNPSAAYQLRITNSKNPLINRGFLSLKGVESSSTPNQLGIYLSDDVFKTPYTFKPAPASQKGLYELYNAVDGEHAWQLMVAGNRVAMEFVSTMDPRGQNVEGGAKFWDKWVFRQDGDLMVLSHAQDYNSSETPSGGAGSWRACEVNSDKEYLMYWYDGSSPLPIKNCEGVLLEAVVAPSDPSVPSSTASFLTGVPAPSGTASFLTGVGPPTASATWITGVGVPTTTGTWLTGVTAPTASVIIGNATSTTKPTPSTFEGSAARVGYAVTGVVGAVVGALAFMV